VITVKQAGGDNFDRELISRHYLTVEARDDLGKGNRNTAQLIINIEDVNDNAPMFLANKYEARLLENERHFENPLVLEARDIDLNGKFIYALAYRLCRGAMLMLMCYSSILCMLYILQNQRSRVRVPVVGRGFCDEQLHLLTSHGCLYILLSI
jgi:hypothetical protein